MSKWTYAEEQMDALQYLEHKKKQIIQKIEDIADQGTANDAVRLKACSTLLNKVMPDRTKLDVDIKNSAPYDALKKAMEEHK